MAEIYKYGPLGGYFSEFDDGSTVGVEKVEIDGLPGVWPKGPSRAGYAHTLAKGMLWELRNMYGNDIPEHEIAYAVTLVNDQQRVQNPEKAYDLAHREAPLRVKLAAARVALHDTKTACLAFQNEHGRPSDHLADPRSLVSAKDRLEAQERYDAQLGPELAAAGQDLATQYMARINQVAELVAEVNDVSS